MDYLETRSKMDTDVRTLDFRDVYHQLYAARSKWHNLGIALKCNNNELSSIQTDPQYKSNSDCLRGMLYHRLQAGGPLTWRDICEALMCISVDHKDIAKKIDPSLKSQAISESSGRKRKHSSCEEDCAETGYIQPPEPKRQANYQTVPHIVMQFNGPTKIYNTPPPTVYPGTSMTTYQSTPLTASVHIAHQPPTLAMPNQPEELNNTSTSSSSPDSKHRNLRDKARTIFDTLRASLGFKAIVELIKTWGWTATEAAFHGIILGGVGLAGYLLEQILEDRGYKGPEYYYADKVVGAAGATIQGAMAAWPFGLWAIIIGALAGFGFWFASWIAGKIIPWFIEKSKQWFSGRQAQ